MKEYTSENIRNVAFLGHSGTGKSTFAEAMLYRQKQVERMGKTEDGNLASDYDPEEQKRQVSINASLLPVETKTTKINVMDCPGSRDFIGEILGCLRVVEGAVIFVDAPSGIQVGSELAMEWVEDNNLPVAIFINKMDKENADFEKTVDSITDVFGKKGVPFTLPIGKEDSFKGVVDVLQMKAWDEPSGQKAAPIDIPEEVKGDVESRREAIIEAAAEGDDALMEKYFEEGTLSDEEVAKGMKAAFMAGTFIPVFCGNATTGAGVKPFLDFMEQAFPSPLEVDGLLRGEGDDTAMQKVDPNGPFSAFVFKTISDDYAGRLTFFKVMTGQLSPGGTVHNVRSDKDEKVSHVMSICGKKQEEISQVTAGDIGVVAKFTDTITNDTLSDTKGVKPYAPTAFPPFTSTVAIHAASSKDEDKIGVGLHALMEQDPTLNLERDPEIKQALLSGMGDQHLDVAVQRLKTKAKVDVVLEKPKVRYRETITRKAEGHYRHKKQSGGRGQFAEVYIRLEPHPEADYEFKWSVFGGAIPTNFSSAVDKGAQQALDKGILAGNRVVNVLVDCYDGKHHDVDSSDMAFQIASSQAFKQTALEAGPIILEPIDLVTTTVPEANMGDVMGDVSQRRGKILGSESKGKKTVVRAHVPAAEMSTYAQNLRSMTGGRGTFEKFFDHYEPVPHEVQQKIIEEHKQHAEEEE